MQIINPHELQAFQETETLSKLLTAADVVDEMIEQLRQPEKAEKEWLMPWPKLKGHFSFRSGEVTVWAGSNGSGKSLITGQVALSLMDQGAKICIASFEMKPQRTVARMMRQFSNRMGYGETDLRKFADRYGEKLFLFDQQGMCPTDQIINLCRFTKDRFQVDHCFIDSLMKVVRGEDDYNAQKDAVDALTAAARDSGQHIHLVHHIRKLKSDDDVPGKFDLRGSSSVSDQVDNVLIVWRNKGKEKAIQDGKLYDPAHPDAMVICEKQRNGESEPKIGLFFNGEGMKYQETAGSSSMGAWHEPDDF